MPDVSYLASAAPAILIVEDHDVVRSALRDWLITIFPDCRVFEARSGEEALPLAAAQPPNIVVMDISLPGMSGIETTRRIKSILPLVPVVVLSIHEESYYQAEARAASADAFVFKRDMQTELVPTLKSLLAAAIPNADSHATAEAS